MLCFFLTPLIVVRYIAPTIKIQTHKIIDTFLLKATIPVTRTPKERGERSRTPAVFPAGHAARRVAPVAFLWEMHVLAIHTPRRAEPSRAASCRVARVHNTCLTPARLPQTRTAVREPGGKRGSSTDARFPMGLGRYTGYSYFAREASSRNTRKRKNEIRASEHSYSAQTCERACINREDYLAKIQRKNCQNFRIF